MAYAVIVGNLGKTPKLETAQSGKKYTRLSVAWSERYKDRAGEWVDGPTTWVSVTVFGRQAENTVASLDKGMMVVAAGDMKTEIWSSDQGEKPVVVMTASVVAPALFTQVATIAKDDQRSTPPQQHQGSSWGTPAPTGQATQDDEQPPF